MQSMIEKSLGSYLINIFFRFSIFTQINLYLLSLGWSKASDCSLNLEIIFSLASYWSLVLSGSAYKGGICLSCIRLSFIKGRGTRLFEFLVQPEQPIITVTFLFALLKCLFIAAPAPVFFSNEFPVLMILIPRYDV